MGRGGGTIRMKDDGAPADKTFKPERAKLNAPRSSISGLAGGPVR